MSRSLMPFGRWDPWESRWDTSRIFDQHFGNVITDEDLLAPSIFSPSAYMRRRPFSRQVSGSIVPRGFSEMTQQSDKFQVMCDVSHFSPEEITVKTVDNAILVTARHEERQDEHGYVSRQFSRRYLLPNDIDPLTVTSSLSPEGILTINAPKRAPDLKENEHMVPINISPFSPQPPPTQIPVQNEPPKAPAP